MVRFMLPGNELVISMETASDYLKEERGGSSFASKYGFCARVVGFEWPPTPPDTIRHLEKELSYLGGLCAASLIKKELKLPPVGQCQLINIWHSKSSKTNSKKYSIYEIFKIIFLHSFHPIHNTSVSDVRKIPGRNFFRWKHRLQKCYELDGNM